MKLWQMMENTFPYIPSRNKNFSMHTHCVYNFFTLKKSKIFQKIRSKKNSSTVPLPDKIMRLWQMMVNTFPYIPSRNKNFGMHTPWDRNFLLSQNTNFSSKKISTSLPHPAKIVKPWWMIVNICPCIPPRNKNFSMHTPWDKKFLHSQNIKFESKKIYFSPPQQAKIMKPWQMMVDICPYVPSKNKNFILHWNWDKNFLFSKNQKFSKNQE